MSSLPIRESQDPRELASSDRDSGLDIPEAQVFGVREGVLLDPGGGDTEAGAEDERDTALAWFAADAARRGQSLTRYLREAGILSDWDWKKIRKHEQPIGEE